MNDGIIGFIVIATVPNEKLIKGLHACVCYHFFLFFSFPLKIFDLSLAELDWFECALSWQDPAYYILKEDTSPCIFGPIEKQRWSYACAKQLVERLIYGNSCPLMQLSFRIFATSFGNLLMITAEGAENGLEFTIVRPFNWIGPRMDFIPGIDGPSEGVPRVLACFSNVSLIFAV